MTLLLLLGSSPKSLVATPGSFAMTGSSAGLRSSNPVKAFFQRLATQPNAADAASYTALIEGLVADGVWAKLEFLYLWDVVDEATGNTNLLNGDYGAAPVNGAVFTPYQGYTGGATNKHVTLGFIPSNGTKFLQNDASIGVWCLTPAAAGTTPVMGRTSATNNLTLYPRYTADVLRGVLNGGVEVALGAIASAAGLSSIERANSTTLEGFKDGVSTGTGASTSSGRGTTELAVLRDNTGYSTQQVAAAFGGARLGATLQLALFNRLRTFLAANSVWAFVAVGSTSSTGAGTATLGEPSGARAGDLLIANFAYRGTSLTSIAPTTLGSEWFAVDEQKTNNDQADVTTAVASGAMFWCLRGASAPTLTFTIPAGTSVCLGRIAAYRNVTAALPASPLDVHSGVTTPTATLNIDVAGLTPSQDKSLLLVMIAAGQDGSFTNFSAATDPTGLSGAIVTTPPSTTAWSERIDTSSTSGSDTALALYDAVKATAGATGNFTVTKSPQGAAHAVIAAAFKISAANAYSLAAGSGSFALTGTVTSLLQARKAAAGAGAFALTGTAASPSPGRKITAGVGAYALTSTAVLLIASRRLAAGVGAFALTGTAASPKVSRKVTAAAGSYALAGTAAVPIPSRSPAFFGVNFSGTEFPTSVTAKYGFPQTSTWQYFASRGIREEIRIPISHERLEPVLGAGFDTTYLNLIKALCVAAESYGCYVTIDLHNFGRFSGASWTSNGYPGQSGDILGGSVYTQAVLVNTWEDLVTELDSYPAVVAYDIMNEPHDLVGVNFFRQPNYIGGDAWFTTNGASAVQQAEGSNPVAGYGPSWVIHAGANYASYLQPVVLTAVPWVIQCKVRCASGTKAGRLYIGAANNGTFTATTTWTLKQFTVTPTAGSNDCGVTVDNIGDDIEVANLQIQPGTTAGTYEPNRWQPIAQAVVTAMRALTSKRIIVAGDNYSSAFYWKRDNYELIIVGDNVEYGAHAYFDANGSGAYVDSYATEGATAARGAARVAPFIDWCATKGVVGKLNEFGIPLNDPDWLGVLETALDALRVAGIRGSEWFFGATGSQDPGDLNMSPDANGGFDAPQIALLTESTGYLAAAAGSYALTGTAVTTRKGKKLAAAAGSYAFTGTAAAPRRNLPLVAGSGSYALTGTATTFRDARKVTADAGSYALTGTAAVPKVARKVTAGAGSFAFTGTSATPRRALPLTASPGSYALTGVAVTLQHSWRVAAGAGAYALTGASVNLPRVYRIAANVGAFNLAGTDANLTKFTFGAYTISPDAGAFALTGVDASGRKTWKLAVTAGSFAFTGSTASFAQARLIGAGSAAFALSGIPVGLVRTYQIDATAGAFALTGADAGLLRGLSLVPEVGSFVLTGSAATPQRSGSRLSAEPGAFTFVGTSAALRYGWRVSVDAGAFALAGSSASFRQNHRVAPAAGSFMLVGSSVLLTARHILIAERVFLVAAEARVGVVAAEDAEEEVTAEDSQEEVGAEVRAATAGAEDRTIAVKAENRTATVN